MEDDRFHPNLQEFSQVSLHHSRERKSAGAGLMDVLRGLVGGGKTTPAEAAARAAFAVVEAPFESTVPEGRMAVFRNVLRLEELTAAEIMTPRADIIAVPETAALTEVAEAFLKDGLTRLPVYRGRLDDVCGFLHAKDVLRVLYLAEPFSMASVKRQILFVPPSMRVPALLLKMRSSRVHMAVVVDEYGATDGLVTFHDLVREIVGETPDEHDEAESAETTECIPCEDGGLLVSARMTVEDLETRLGFRLTEAEEDIEYETVGGLLISLLGRVPNVGEGVRHAAGVQFLVTEADPRRVKKVKVIRAE